MPSASGFLVAASLGLALLSLPARAQAGPSGAATATPEATAPEASESEEVAPHEMTCAEIKETFGVEEQEDEASYLLVWAYGVRTGAQGLDFEKHPVTRAGLEEFLTRLILTCKADPDKLFVDAILE